MARQYTLVAASAHNALTARVEKTEAAGIVTPQMFGALADGGTDDTAAINSAISAVGSDGIVTMRGDYVFDPDSLDFSGASQKIAFHVSGTLRPTTTIQYTSDFEIIGVSGAAPSFVQFTKGACCSIIPPSGDIPVIRVSGSTDNVLKNVSIFGCYKGIVADGTAALGANLRMENVNIYASRAGGCAFEIDAFFWIWACWCTFFGSGCKSVIINNSAATYAQATFLYFNDCITAGGGIDATPDTAQIGKIYFTRHHHESLPTGEHFFECTRSGAAYNVQFEQLAVSDSWEDAGEVFNVPGVLDLRVSGSQPLSFAAYPETLQMDVIVRSAYARDAFVIGSDQKNKLLFSSGDLDTRPMWRPIAGPTLSLGSAVALNLASAGDVTITTGQPAPDGSTTASLFSVPAGSAATAYSLTVANKSLALDGGDILAWGGWFRAEVEGDDIGGFDTGGAGGLHMVARVPVSSGLDTVSDTQLFGLAHKWRNVGWVFQFGLFEMNGTATGNSTFICQMRSRQGRNYYTWQPFARHFPASLGMNKADVMRYLTAIGSPPNAPSGGIALRSHQTMTTGTGATASRPSASTVGAGAQWFDTTLNQPIWSTGSGWVTADGTAA